MPVRVSVRVRVRVKVRGRVRVSSSACVGGGGKVAQVFASWRSLSGTTEHASRRLKLRPISRLGTTWAALTGHIGLLVSMGPCLSQTLALFSMQQCQQQCLTLALA